MAEPFVPPPSKAGNYAKLADLASSGDVIALSKGFLRDDPDNTYQGQASPRHVIEGRNLTTDEDVKISSPKLTTDGDTNGRAEFFEALDKYLEANANEVVAVRFTETPSSRYVGVEVAEQ